MTPTRPDIRHIAWAASWLILFAASAFAQSNGGQGAGTALITVLPRHEGEVTPSVANQDLSFKVNGKAVKVTEWAPPDSSGSKMELVLLIDDSARSSLGTQLSEIADFVRTLPPATKAAIAYMRNGRATFMGPLSSNHDEVLRALHIPASSGGASSSPYFCLSDLAKNWPSADARAHREVILITDGVDRYQAGLDTDDPYVRTSITDAVTARLVVYSIYWAGRGRSEEGQLQTGQGQNLVLQVTQATGGKSFGLGFGNPVSFQPYFAELTRRLRNQYELSFEAPLNGKPAVESFRLKLVAPGSEVAAPQQVLVAPAAAH